MDKKKIFAIAVFFLMGFFMFTFANPADDTEKILDNNNNTIDDTNPTFVNNQNNNANNNLNNAPMNTPVNIVVNFDPEVITIIEGEEYDLMSGVIVNIDNYTVTTDIEDLSTLLVGEHTVKYTVTDGNGNTTTVERKVVVLDPNGDEDKDGFTNKEEKDADTDLYDELSHPETIAPVISVEDITLEVKTPYVEQYALKLDAHDKVTKFEDVKIDGEVDTDKLGVYTLTYSIKDVYGKEATATKTVKVVDTTKPVITLKGTDIIIRTDDKYEELGASATDNYDEDVKVDITGSVLNEKGTYIVSYNAKDSSGNEAITVTRKVSVVDTKELEEATSNANEILNNDNTNPRDDLKELLDELKDANEKGLEIIDDRKSSQDLVDNATDTIEEIIEKINSLEFTVTFLDDDKKTVIGNPIIVKYNKSVEKLPENPSKEGHSFTKWNGKYKNIVNDEKVYAEYSINSYTLKVDNETYTYKFNETIKEIKNPETPGYKFDKYLDENNEEYILETTMPAHDITITRKYSPITYSIKYNLNGGENNSENPHTYNILSNTITLKDAVRKGYTFEKWLDSNNNEVKTIDQGSYGDITLTAKYNAAKSNYTVITYKETLVSGKYESSKANFEDVTDSAITVTPDELDGFTLNTNMSTLSGKVLSDDSLVISIYYNRNNYTLKVDNETYTYKFEENINEINNPSKSGYEFDKYLDENEEKYILETTMPAHDITITRKYSPITYTITYNLNGGENSLNNPSTYNIETDTITLENASKLGYTFKGWYNNKGRKVTTIVKGSKDDLTLTAKFDIDTYTITYNLNGGRNDRTNPTTYTVNSKYTLKDATKTNYDFVGWYDQNDNLVKTTEGKTGDLTLTAKYQAKQTGIVIKEKVNAQLFFEQGKSYNLKDYIDVYKEYADGTISETPLADNEYTVSGFNTTTSGVDKTATVTQNNTTFKETVKYTVSKYATVQSKFRVTYVENNYRVTNTNKCYYGDGKLGRCDQEITTKSTPTSKPIFEITEDYYEAIVIKSVKVTYNNGTTKNLTVDDEVVRWSYKEDYFLSEYTYNPVYIGRLYSNGKFVDPDIAKVNLVTVRYTLSGKTYEVVFQKQANNIFKAVDEYKVK